MNTAAATVSIRRALPADAQAVAQVRIAGRRLDAAVVKAQRAHGATGLLTWVIAGNRGARTFYERLGGEVLAEPPFQCDGMNLVEAGYGWGDLDALTPACNTAAASQHPHIPQTRDGRAA